MAAETIITDPFLQSVLETVRASQQQCLNLLEEPEATLEDEQSQDLSKQQRLLGGYMARLRGLNRSTVHRVRETKQETSEARAEVDTLHLQLQNLYYEQRHLRGEIIACESYDHKFQSLPLIPVEEFLELKAGFNDADETALMEARINHEHAERETLESQRQGLLRKKQSLIAENKKRKDDLASLDQDLEKFIDAAKPIQKIFEKEY